MSLIAMGLDSAVAIAERNSRRVGSSVYSRRGWAALARNFLALKTSSWFIVFSGFFEPVFYLAAFGFGIGQLIGDLSDASGTPVSYAAFIAPALLASSAMNGAIYDSTWNVFFKMHFGKLYQGMLATSMGPLDVALGEISWALLRGLAYALGFMAIVVPLGLVPSWWGLLAIPAALLVAFAFASLGMGVTSYITGFQGMNWIQFFLLPMFLFSGTFFPISVYPEWLQVVVMGLPLWHAVELVRSLTLGLIHPGLLWHVLYFLVIAAFGLVFTTRRLNALFMR
jgi:lipooligosaccharide transport system permease protein